MLKDDKPRSSGNDAANMAPINAAEEDWAIVRARGELFEDILDVEGPVRVAMAAVAGFALPGVEELERGVTLLEGRIPETANRQLGIHTLRLRAAAEAGDAAGVRREQGAVVDLLSALRQSD